MIDMTCLGSMHVVSVQWIKDSSSVWAGFFLFKCCKRYLNHFSFCACLCITLEFLVSSMKLSLFKLLGRKILLMLFCHHQYQYLLLGGGLGLNLLLGKYIELHNISCTLSLKCKACFCPGKIVEESYLAAVFSQYTSRSGIGTSTITKKLRPLVAQSLHW
jgi:hypothetical protein